MKVLVSQREAFDREGREDGFHHTEEGEILVTPSLVCDGPKSNRDRCGCGRAFSGVNSGSGTTVGVVAEVEDIDHRLEKAIEAVRARTDDDEWTNLMAEHFRADVAAFADTLKVAPVGSVAEIESSPTTYNLEVFEPRD